MAGSERARPDLKWLFVTGAPRSGTTFVAEILRAAKGVVYVHEPFNPSCGVEGLRDRYLYIAPDAADDRSDMYAEVLDRLVALKPVTFRTREWPTDPQFVRFAKRLAGGRGAMFYRLARWHRHPSIGVLKDPTAFFLIPFLESRAALRTVIVLRHPASWVASFLRTGWSPELELIRRQDQILELLPQADRALLESPLDRLEQICVFWRLAYGFMLSRSTRPIVVRHESVSARPGEEFRSLFDQADVPWSSGVERRIRGLTAHSSVDGRSGRLSDLRRHSASIFETRLEQLSPSERSTVWALTNPVAAGYYDRASFSLEAGS